MAKAIQLAIVVLCLICILAILIAPLADLPATSLRSYQMAVVLIWGLIAGALLVAFSGLRSLSLVWLAEAPSEHRTTSERPALADSYCILRC